MEHPEHYIMTGMDPPVLKPVCMHGGTVNPSSTGYKLELLDGTRGCYRLAQLDDYSGIRRNQFPHHPPIYLSLRLRVSSADLPGTWGVGLWNDPFGLSFGLGNALLRLPALPQAAWFFYGSSENWLSLGEAPSHNFFAGTFQSVKLPAVRLAPAAVLLPFLPIHPISRILRNLMRKFISQDGRRIDIDVTQWHDYRIEWRDTACSFFVDGVKGFETTTAPTAPLGLVIWIDNQFAAWQPDGTIRYGTLANPYASMDLEDIRMGKLTA